MQILISKRFEEDLQMILKQIHTQLGCKDMKNFKLYLDTIIANIPTKLHKYKVSSFFDDENIKEVDYNGFKIFIYEDKMEKNIVLLSIA